MKYKKKIKKHVEEKYVIDKVICDICKKEIFEKMWEGNDITINAKIGNVYPECDTREEYNMDCCRDCFEEKILPALKKIGTVNKFNAEDDALEKMKIIS